MKGNKKIRRTISLVLIFFSLVEYLNALFMHVVLLFMVTFSLMKTGQISLPPSFSKILILKHPSLFASLPSLVLVDLQIPFETFEASLLDFTQKKETGIWVTFHML
jgi:hypothetical protein